MTESLEHLTTSFILPEGEGYSSRRRRLEARSSLLAREAGKLYSMWEVLRRPIPLGGRESKVWCRCMVPGCGVVRLVRIADLHQGKTTNCGVHHRQNPYYQTIPQEAHTRLRQRYNRIQGATDPNGTNPAYAAYRRKGTKNLFASVEDFVRYVWENLPHSTYRDVEIDRIENDGHYAPGNLRLATRLQNAQNRSCNRMVTWDGNIMSASKFAREYCPKFHYSTVTEMVKNGATPEQIIAHQFAKQPGVTSSRQKSTTSSTPAPGIGSPPTER